MNFPVLTGDDKCPLLSSSSIELRLDIYFSTNFETLKSSILIYNVFSSTKNTLVGLRSLWITPFSCIKSTAQITYLIIFFAYSSVKGPFSVIVRIYYPSTFSITKYPLLLKNSGIYSIAYTILGFPLSLDNILNSLSAWINISSSSLLKILTAWFYKVTLHLHSLTIVWVP